MRGALAATVLAALLAAGQLDAGQLDAGPLGSYEPRVRRGRYADALGPGAELP